jgi:hypothetical protein
MIQPDPVPMLWVVPPDLIRNIYPETLVSFLGSLDDVQVWHLDGGALAFSLPDILVKWGRPLDDEVFLKRTRPLFRFLEPYTLQNHSALDLEIPDEKFWVRITLQPEETDRRVCAYVKSHLNGWTPFAFKVYSVHELIEKDVEDMKRFILDWLQNTESRPVFGESLHIGSIELAYYKRPGGKRSYPETGFEVRCANYLPCTWPWIDLYLRMRRELPGKKRLSIRFFNETDPKASV